MRKLQSKWLYAVCAVLAPVAGAAAGMSSAMLLCIMHMGDAKNFSQEELEELSPYGYVADFASDKARAALQESFVWIIVASLLVFAVSFIILNIMTGNMDRDEEGRIRLNWFDRLWSELHIVAGLFAAATAVIIEGFMNDIPSHADWFSAYKPLSPDDYVFGISNTTACVLGALGMAVMIEAAIFCWLSLVKKIKAHELLNRSLCGKIVVMAWGGLRRAWNVVRTGIRSMSVPDDTDQKAAFKLILKYCLIAAVLILFPVISGMVFFSFDYIFMILPALIAIAIAAYIIVRRIGKLAEIRSGVIAVKSGELTHRITVDCDERGPKTELDRLASDINHISEATDAAVQNEIRNQRLKTDLISNVSHDLKTPLTSMISYLDILEKEGLDSPDAPAHLAVVREKTDRLKTLTEELFEAAKASSGNIPCEIEDIDIAALIDQSLAEMGDRLAAKDLVVRKNIKAENTVVRADGRLMYRVFENMLSNISKYALEGSRVYIDVTEAEHQPGRLLIEFKNISRDELNISADELLERFTRGDESRNTEGSGLGLAIAKDLMTLMGGSFSISIDGDMFKASIMI